MTSTPYDLQFMNRDDAASRLRSNRWTYYVYVLGTSGGVPFYVGKGTRPRVFQHEAEARNTNRRTHKLNVIRKLHRQGIPVLYALPNGFEHEADSLRAERDLIAAIGRHDLGTGPLTNQTDGGEGPSNPSEESRRRHLASLGGNAEDPRAASSMNSSMPSKASNHPFR